MVARRSLSLPLAALLEVPALGVVETLAPASHVPDAALYGVAGQARGGALQTVKVLLPAFAAGRFPLQLLLPHWCIHGDGMNISRFRIPMSRSMEEILHHLVDTSGTPRCPQL